MISPDKQGYSIKNKLLAWNGTIISSGFIFIIIIIIIVIIIIIHHSSFIIHHSSIINHHGKNHQQVDLNLRFAHMWVIFKGSLGHNSMAHWCSIPVEQGDAGSKKYSTYLGGFWISHIQYPNINAYMSLSHRSSKYQNISYSKHHKKGAILYIYIYICVCVLQMYRSQIMCMPATKGYHPMGSWASFGVFIAAEIETMTVTSRRYHPQTFIKYHDQLG